MDCKYHDNKKANWHCTNCDISFCMDCVELETRAVAPRCILCRTHISRLTISDQVEPFWNRLNHFNAYPFQAGAKSFLIFYSIAALVLGFLIDVIPLPLIGLVLRLTLFAILVSYVFSVLSRTAKGNFAAPKYDQTITYDSDGMTVKVIVLFIILFLLGVGIVSSSGGTGLVIYQAAIAFFMPSILVTLGMSKHLSSALNPRHMIGTIVSIGFPYLILVGFAALINFSLSFATGFIDTWLPDPIVYFVSKTIEAFFYIILFNMLGYVVYQYHAELGYGVDVEQLATNENIQMKPELRALAHADVYIQEARYDDARDQLYKAGQSVKHQEEAYSKLIKLHIATKNDSEMLNAARLYFENPELHLYGFNAWQTYQQIKKIEPRYRPANVNGRLVLIKQIRNKALRSELIYLTEDLEQKFAHDPVLPEALLAEVKFYIDVEHDDATGLSKLQGLLDNYPKGKHRLESEELLKALQH